MIRAPHWILLATGTALAAAAAEGKTAAGAEDARCTATRLLSDGRQVRADMPPGLSGVSGASAGRGSGTAWASSGASGRSGSTASSSSSSASSSGGRSFARSTASHTDTSGRTITIIRDERGCRVTIDERTTGED